MNSYWKVKMCLADKGKGDIVTRLYPNMETFDLSDWGGGYWSRKMKKDGLRKNRFFSLYK